MNENTSFSTNDLTMMRAVTPVPISPPSPTRRISSVHPQFHFHFRPGTVLFQLDRFCSLAERRFLPVSWQNSVQRQRIRLLHGLVQMHGNVLEPLLKMVKQWKNEQVALGMAVSVVLVIALLQWIWQKAVGLLVDVFIWSRLTRRMTLLLPSPNTSTATTTTSSDPQLATLSPLAKLKEWQDLGLSSVCLSALFILDNRANAIVNKIPFWQSIKTMLMIYMIRRGNALALWNKYIAKENDTLHPLAFMGDSLASLASHYADAVADEEENEELLAREKNENKVEKNLETAEKEDFVSQNNALPVNRNAPSRAAV